MLYVGIMSGTSLDGVDAAIVDLRDGPKLRGFVSLPFPQGLRETLLRLSQANDNELHTAALVSNQLAELYAAVVNELLTMSKLRAADISAIGCHGQTVRHRPDLGFTIQLQNPALLAELTGIAVIADFRSRDIAAGGQGAPLVPAFHDAVFRHPSLDRAIVNIGGISNVTLLLGGQRVWGFDCGPGNMLMDCWANRYLGQPFDANGRWASSGKVIPSLLIEFLDDSYFAKPPPKSTGRDLFSLTWLDEKVSGTYRPEDVQATLLELTARAISNDIDLHGASCKEVFVCGGGAQSETLMARLGNLMTGRNVKRTDELGIPAQQVEAIAFAWLAREAIDGRPIDLTRATGSRHPNVLGAIYPA